MYLNKRKKAMLYRIFYYTKLYNQGANEEASSKGEWFTFNDHTWKHKNFMKINKKNIIRVSDKTTYSFIQLHKWIASFPFIVFLFFFFLQVLLAHIKYQQKF